jgi:hypothetical protein
MTAAFSRTCSSISLLTIFMPISVKSRIMESTSRPTYPTSVNFEASILRNGAWTSLASLRAISVLPTPVGPIMMMFFGMTSSRSSSDNRCRLQRFRSAMATARLALCWPMMYCQFLDGLTWYQGVIQKPPWMKSGAGERVRETRLESAAVYPASSS